MITCTDITCKYNNEKCKCTARNINLTHGTFNTVYQGKIRRLKCNAYKESERYKEIREKFKEINLKSILEEGEKE